MGGDGAGGKTIQLQHGQLTVGLPECPQETLRVGEARAKDTVLSKHLCKGFTSVSSPFQGPKSHET